LSKLDVEYEKFVQEVYQRLNQAEGIQTIKVQHNVKLKGKRTGLEHQIDVYWEFESMGVTHRIAVECKNYASAISKDKIQSFATVLDDIGDIRGIFATKSRYQSGAKTIAEQYGISIVEIRPPTDADWDGLMRDITINIIASIPVHKNTEVDLDLVLAKQNYAPKVKFNFSIGDDTPIVNSENKLRQTVGQLYNSVAKEESTTENSTGIRRIATHICTTQKIGCSN